MMTNDNTITALSAEQVKELILNYDSEFCNTLNKAKADLEAKNKAEELCNQEKQSPAKPDGNKILHFQRLGPNDSHTCDVCKGILAELQQGENYFCKSCFDKARLNAEADGCRFTEDMHEFPEEAPIMEA